MWVVLIFGSITDPSTHIVVSGDLRESLGLGRTSDPFISLLVVPYDRNWGYRLGSESRLGLIGSGHLGADLALPLLSTLHISTTLHIKNNVTRRIMIRSP